MDFFNPRCGQEKPKYAKCSHISVHVHLHISVSACQYMCNFSSCVLLLRPTQCLQECRQCHIIQKNMDWRSSLKMKLAKSIFYSVQPWIPSEASLLAGSLADLLAASSEVRLVAMALAGVSHLQPQLRLIRTRALAAGRSLGFGGSGMWKRGRDWGDRNSDKGVLMSQALVCSLSWLQAPQFPFWVSYCVTVNLWTEQNLCPCLKLDFSTSII